MTLKGQGRPGKGRAAEAKRKDGVRKQGVSHTLKCSRKECMMSLGFGNPEVMRDLGQLGFNKVCVGGCLWKSDWGS